EGRIGDVSFDSLEKMRESTTEQNAIEVDLAIFADDVAIPDSAFGPIDVPSLELAAGSAAIDAGVAIPGLNDGFTGDAPDLGAHELGHEPPTYGPDGSLGGPPDGAGGGGAGAGGEGSGASGGGDGSGPGAGGASASGPASGAGVP